MTQPTTFPWTPDIEVNAEIVSAVVGAQFPEFAGMAPTKVGAGWDNAVWRIGDTTFRFPHREVALKYLANETALMPWLGPKLPLPVPRAKYFGEPSKRFPRPFIGCDWIEGTPIEHAELTLYDRVRLAAPPPASTRPLRATIGLNRGLLWPRHLNEGTLCLGHALYPVLR